MPYSECPKKKGGYVSSISRGMSGHVEFEQIGKLCGDEFMRVLLHVLVVLRGHEGLESSIDDLA